MYLAVPSNYASLIQVNEYVYKKKPRILQGISYSKAKKDAKSFFIDLKAAGIKNVANVKNDKRIQ